MAETTSDELQLLLMETGGRSNDWGTQTNANLVKIEAAIAGLEALASTGGTTTLTDDQARNGILNITGTLASSHIVVVPNRTKSWVVRNGHTLGAYTLTMKTSAGVAIEIPTGTHLVFCNGAAGLYRVGFSTVANSDLADMATGTVKANITGSTADPADVTLAALTDVLPVANLTARVDDLAYAQIAATALADAAAFRAKTASKLLSAEAAWDAAAFVALSDGATITPDFSVGLNFSVTLGGNRTLANPTNPKVGQSGILRVTQDATGSRTLSFGSYYKFADATAPSPDTVAERVNVYSYFVLSSTEIVLSMLRGVR